MASEYEDWKRLTFEQAEGAEPLPSQLQPKELSSELRALLWEVFHKSMQQGFASDVYGNPWNVIPYNLHIYRYHRLADEYISTSYYVVIKTILLHGNYLDVFGTVQWILRDSGCPSGLVDQIEGALRRSRAAYAVFDGDTIIPVGSEAERDILSRAFADLAASKFHGARAHLRSAGSELTAGNYAASVRAAPPLALLGPLLFPPVALCRIIDDPSRRVALLAGRAVKLTPAIECSVEFLGGIAMWQIRLVSPVPAVNTRKWARRQAIYGLVGR
jgi:hypothetical protein